MKIEKKIMSTAAFLGIVSIVLGAFAAHGLASKLQLEQLKAFNTGVRYQMYHTIVLLCIGSYQKLNDNAKVLIFRVMLLGIILFSGSIYLLSTQNILGVDVKFLGIVTPIGGLVLIVSWGLMLRSFLNLTRPS